MTPSEFEPSRVDPATRASLIVRLRDPQDERAWSEFVASYGPLVRDLARRKGLQPADAADLEQDVFRAVASAIDRYDPDPALGSFRAWLSRIARNLIVNALIRINRHPRGSGDSAIGRLLEAQEAAGADPAETALVEAEWRRHVFRWAADRVKGDFRESTWLAFWRTAVDGQPAADVAAALGLTAGAVYVARNRVMARIRRAIEEIEGTGTGPDD